mgnify:CR=1 FL=1
MPALLVLPHWGHIQLVLLDCTKEAVPGFLESSFSVFSSLIDGIGAVAPAAGAVGLDEEAAEVDVSAEETVLALLFFIALRISEVFFQIRTIIRVNSKPRRLRSSRRAQTIRIVIIPVIAIPGA